MVGWPVACVIALGCAPTIHRDKATPISTNDSYARHPSVPTPPRRPELPRYSSLVIVTEESSFRFRDFDIIFVKQISKPRESLNSW